MNFSSLSEIASYIVSDGKGILAADESNPTCTKRFDSIGVESTEDNRRDYRELLFRSEGMKGNIGGVILFDETIRQTAADGTSLVDIITSQGSIPGIKVDKGLQQIGDTEESLTQGLEGLDERLKEYYEIGAKFTKWRAVISIGEGMPSSEAISANMEALAEYAKIVQNNNMVPMVEPEVLMDGNHSIDDCFEATSRCLDTLFACLLDKEVDIKGTILKPNLVLTGDKCSKKSDKKEIDEISIYNSRFLIDRNCKIIVVACNTATTNSISKLRRKFKVPFIGIEPAIKPAALNSKTKKVGVLATKGTLTSNLFFKTSSAHNTSATPFAIIYFLSLIHISRSRRKER